MGKGWVHEGEGGGNPGRNGGDAVGHAAGN